MFNIKKVLSRLLVFFIGLPLTLALVFFLPQKNHLAVNITAVILSSLAAFELSRIFAVKNIIINKITALLLGAFLPFFAMLDVSFNLKGAFFYSIFAGLFFIALKTVFTKIEKIESLLLIFASEITLLFYPGLLLTPIIFLGVNTGSRVLSINSSSAALISFLLIVIINDSFAWFFGVLFGKNNRGLVKISPNKSAAGFAGGILCSAAAGAVLQFAGAFGSSPPRFAGLFIGLICAVCATFGDLAESALKRSAGVKDSGTIFPGRGGVLDSLDSIAVTAPVFYLLYHSLELF